MGNSEVKALTKKPCTLTELDKDEWGKVWVTRPEENPRPGWPAGHNFWGALESILALRCYQGVWGRSLAGLDG